MTINRLCSIIAIIFLLIITAILIVSIYYEEQEVSTVERTVNRYTIIIDTNYKYIYEIGFNYDPVIFTNNITTCYLCELNYRFRTVVYYEDNPRKYWYDDNYKNNSKSKKIVIIFELFLFVAILGHYITKRMNRNENNAQNPNVVNDNNIPIEGINIVVQDDYINYIDENKTLARINLRTNVVDSIELSKDMIKIHLYNYPNCSHNNVETNGSHKQCSICLCDYIAEDKIFELSCNHVFHNTCLIKWLQQKKICPICNFIIN